MEGLYRATLPSGIQIASGGTRTAIKLSRPWQLPMAADDPQNCAFVKDPGDAEQLDGWRLRQNRFTPFPFHRLMIPDDCLSTDTIYELGGSSNHMVFETASRVAQEKGLELWVSVHIGALAGQNIPHLHFHLLSPIGGGRGETPREIEDLYHHNDGLLLHQQDEFRVVAGGLRAGQCFILTETTESGGAETSDFFTRLSSVIGHVIQAYKGKFTSEQGLPPDFMVGIHLNSLGGFMYGEYIPILNHWGLTEYGGLLAGTPIILPWPHQVTVEHVRSGLTE